MKIAPILVTLLCALPAGCSFSVGTGSGNTPSSDPASADSTDPGTPAVTAVTPESKAWFDQCSAHYDEFMSKWKPIDDEAHAAIKEAEGATFYASAAKLTSQLVKTCVSGKELRAKSIGYADRRGTALALRIAVAKLQLRASKGSNRLFTDAMEHEMVESVPTVQDDSFDRNAFCLAVHNANGLPLPDGTRFAPLSGTRHNSAHWMTSAELAKFNERYSALTKETADTLSGLAKQYVHSAGEVGKIKQVKKSADGSTTVVAKRVEAPYECKHTGVYTWSGTSYNDCTYVDLPAVEIYGFTARFPVADPPPVDLKVGDYISFSGTTGGKVPNNNEKTDAKWDVNFVWSVTRNKKPIHELVRINDCY